MSIIHEWALVWGVPLAAVQDLQRRTGTLDAQVFDGWTDGKKNEDWVSREVRLEASRRGDILWRNNVGALRDERGVPIRYGLANDSKALNEVVKSADLIGIHRLEITHAMVGTTVGQFYSVETKEPGWQYSATPREVAQNNWLLRVNALGGRALFTASPEDI